MEDSDIAFCHDSECFSPKTVKKSLARSVEVAEGLKVISCIIVFWFLVEEIKSVWDVRVLKGVMLCWWFPHLVPSNKIYLMSMLEFEELRAAEITVQANDSETTKHDTPSLVPWSEYC